MKKMLSFFCVIALVVSFVQPEYTEKNGAVKFVITAIGQHLIGKGVDYVINNPPKLPPPSPPNDPSMPVSGGVIGGGRYGREF